MSGWEVVSVLEDLDSEDGHRWLIVYRVPVEYAPDGVYSVSLPKDIFNGWAAIYGYDVDDPQDVEALFDHVTYQAYINEVLRREGRADEIIDNPFHLGADEARARVQAHVAEFKQSRPITQSQMVKVAAGDLVAGARNVDVHDVIRADMHARLDKAVVAERADAVKDTRAAVQARLAARKATR